MRWARLLGISLLIVGGALIGASVAIGEGKVSLIVVVPVFWASGALGFLGIGALFLGFAVLLFFGPWFQIVPSETPSASTPPPGEPDTTGAKSASPRYGGLIVVGPFPVAFGTDRQLTMWMLVIGIVIAAAFVMFTLLYLVNQVWFPSP